MRKSMTVLTVAAIGLWITGSMARAQTNAIRDGKETGTSFRLASERPAKGFEAMNISREERLYVAGAAIFAGSDVTASEAVEVKNGNEVKLSLKPGVLDRVRTEMRASGADRLAMMSGGKVVATSTATIDGDRLSLGGLNATQATRITQTLNRANTPTNNAGAAVTLVPSQGSVAPGGSLVVDAFVSNASDLRSYQLTLAIAGGDAGGLTLSSMQIDNTRGDYVFGTQQKFDAVDDVGGRLGGVLFSGGVDVTNPAYLGTFTLNATSDARGTFNVKVEQAARSSMLFTNGNEDIEFSSPTIQINVGTLKPGIRSRD